MARDPVLKRFAVDIDLKRAMPRPEFEVVHGDTGSVLDVTVYDDGTPVDLTGLLVIAVVSGSMGTCLFDSSEGGVTISGSTASVTLPAAAVSPGLVSCELQIYSSTHDVPVSKDDYDVLVTTARFPFTCREAMFNEVSFEAMPQAPLLMALLSSAEAAEAARMLAENSRVLAETARARAESARVLAESQREREFAAMMAQAGSGIVSGSGAPTDATEGVPGGLYFDTAGHGVYVCTEVQNRHFTWKPVQYADGAADSLTVTRTASYLFEDLPAATPVTIGELMNRLGGWYSEINGKQDALTFDSAPTSGSAAPVTSGGVYAADHYEDWVTIADVTLSADASILNVTQYDSQHGGGAFAFDELMLYYLGSMKTGTAARVYVNGAASPYIKFNNFVYKDADLPEGCAASLHLKKPVNGFVYAERTYGGDFDESGFALSNAEHGAFAAVAGAEAYTALRLTPDSASSRFASGSRVILLGRNRR